LKGRTCSQKLITGGDRLLYMSQNILFSHNLLCRAVSRESHGSAFAPRVKTLLMPMSEEFVFVPFRSAFHLHIKPVNHIIKSSVERCSQLMHCRSQKLHLRTRLIPSVPRRTSSAEGFHTVTMCEIDPTLCRASCLPCNVLTVVDMFRMCAERESNV
jgi:hypothetical protein